MDEFVKGLIQKEKDLRIELERTPVFKQWEAIKNAIQQFDSPPYKIEHVDLLNKPSLKIPDNYDDKNLTWREKVLFAISKLSVASVSQIKDLLKKNGTKETDDFLDKRIGITVSRLKVKEKVIDAKMDGKKGFYFIK